MKRACWLSRQVATAPLDARPLLLPMCEDDAR